MKILALETSTDASSAALITDDDLYVAYELAPRKHTKLILKQLEHVLDEAQIKLADVDAIAFGCGPGAFTGLRIAAGVTQGIALSVNKPVIPISSLAAVAQQALQQLTPQQHHIQHIWVAQDARMKEMYIGHYKAENGIVQLIDEEKLCKPEHLQQPDAQALMKVGSGWEVYQDEIATQLNISKEELHQHCIAEIYPSAKEIALLASHAYRQGNTLPAEQAQPVYLRNKIAQTIKERAANGKI